MDFFEKISHEKVTLETSINNDLEFAGLDADLMLEAFSEEFNVDLSQINYEKFFLGAIGPHYLFLKLFKKNKLLRTPLTIRHMVEVAEKGFWFEPKD